MKKMFAVDEGSGCRKLDLKPAVQIAIAEAVEEAFAELENDELEEDGVNVRIDVLVVDKIINHVKTATANAWEGEIDARKCFDAYVGVERDHVTVKLHHDGMDET